MNERVPGFYTKLFEINIYKENDQVLWNRKEQSGIHL